VRRAGVMATGMGGTNAHLVLEEAPEAAPAAAAQGPQLILLSARTPAALHAAGGDLAAFLEAGGAGDPDPLPEVAHTLQTGRRFFAHRRFVVCHRRADAVAALRTNPSPASISSSGGAEPLAPVTFLLPGVGDHYVGMGQGLYEQFEVFRREVDACAEWLRRTPLPRG
jgi:phthiocerol/phenolphthiocerol synthesis type-I polyketide synthase E